MPKKQKRKAKRKRRSARSGSNGSVSTAIVARVPLPANKAWELTREEVVLVKNLICKGATDEEFQMCLARARHHRLDPLKQQIWFVPRWDSGAENPDGSKGRKVWVAQVGINGLRHIAARDHQDYGTEDEPEFGPKIEVSWSVTYGKETKSGKFKAPEWARVSAWKKGAERPTVATVDWEEIYPDVGRAPLVRQMPKLMLGKCAAAQAIRKAYPETGGLYIPEEFAGARPDFTPDGRRIEYADDVPMHGSKAASDKVLADKLSGKMPLNPPQEPQTNAETAKPVEPKEKVIDVAATDVKQPGAKRGVVEVDFTDNKAHPIVRGDIQEIYVHLQTRCSMTWDEGASWNRIPAEKVPVLRELCKQAGFDLKEFPSSTPKTSGGGSRAAEGCHDADRRSTSPSAGKGGGSSSHASDSPTAIKGTIQQFTEKMTAGKGKRGATPYMNILLKTETGDRWYSCFDRDIFQFISKGKGKEGEFFVQKSGEYNNLVGLKRIGSLEFEEGKIPVQQRDREAGTPRLWT